MNRIIISTLFVIVIASAKLSPSSQVELPNWLESEFIPDSAGLLITENFGVVVVEASNDCMLSTFSVGGRNFSFYQNDSVILISGCTPQLIDNDDSSFLVFCVDQQNATGYAMISLSVNAEGNFTIENNGTFFNTTQFPVISASAFVTAQGNVYLATPSSDSDNQISILEFNVDTFESVVKIEDVASLIPGAKGSSWTVQDMHSLPHDAGVQLILNNNDDSADNSSAQAFVFVYFNDTVVVNDIPEGQTLTYVGRHKGSSFGYTVGTSGDTPYTVVTAWDLSDHTVGNSVQIKGYTGKEATGHFSTSEEVYVFTSNGDDEGYIYELPYSERGFLPNSVNFVATSSSILGNLGDGVDTKFVYALTQQGEEGDDYVTRWSI